MSALEVSNIVLNFTTALALLVGGAWALWKWGFNRKREIYSIDGTMKHTRTPIGELECSSIVGNWVNKGPDPIPISTKHTCVEYYKILGNFPSADLTPHSGNTNLELEFANYPFANLENLILEPSTESTLSSHSLLTREQDYIVRFVLVRADDESYMWDRSMFSPRVVVETHSEE